MVWVKMKQLRKRWNSLFKRLCILPAVGKISTGRTIVSNLRLIVAATYISGCRVHLCYKPQSNSIQWVWSWFCFFFFSGTSFLPFAGTWKLELIHPILSSIRGKKKILGRKGMLMTYLERTLEFYRKKLKGRTQVISVQNFGSKNGGRNNTSQFIV